MSPRVSVLMPVYNGEQYLAEAIESILNQTFADFEFIIIDDASQDGSLSIVRDFARRDKRIQIIENQDNLGLSISLNKGIRAARGEYIARMDADDISTPQRFEDQVAFMDANPDIGICGTWVEYFGGDAEILKFPLNHDAIYARMLFENALAHPSVMMRAISIKEQGLLYDEEVQYAQDYELWSRAVIMVKLANIDQILLRYRIHSQRIGSKYGREQHQTHGLIYRRLLARFGLNFTSEDIHLHQLISTHRYGDDIDFIRRAQHWLEMISASNEISRTIPQETLDVELGEIWARVCQQSPLHPVKILIYILFHPLRFRGSASFQKVLMRIWFLFGRVLFI